MSQIPNIQRFAEYRTVGEAAEFLGVSTATLRNWDRNGKLKPRRHPKNGYRIYRHEDLEALLRSTQESHESADSSAGQFDWGLIDEQDHFVQFYESDEFLVRAVSDYVAAALTKEQAAAVVATSAHRKAVQRRLSISGIDLPEAMEAGRYVVLDAADTLSKFMVNGWPDPHRFNETVGRAIAQLAADGRRVHAFGEMVALLWSDGRGDAAIRLEELWNELGKRHRFALFCAYPLAGFGQNGEATPFNGICNCHTRVVPGESYADLADPDERLRAIASLQQKAQSLEAEIVHRKAVEAALAKRERELAEADRRKDEFLATLAHELRNPLAPIGIALEMLKRDGAKNETRDEAQCVIERQVKQFTRLVDDLLDLSRITRDKIELRKERVELAAIVKDAVETSRPLIDASNHDLTVKLPQHPIYLNADPTRLAQVFANLLNNSAKYTQRGGQIEIAAEKCDDEVAVTVTDNGIGLSSEALAYVFDMFRQVDQSLERSQGGLGIGLTLVRRLVELHGGAVHARSDGPGKGSAFRVRLPVAAAEAPPKPTSAAPQAALPRCRFLVVDDNKDVGDMLTLLLQTKGHDVRTARDGLAAIDVAAEFLPDVILMDVGMPKLNGYDATERIRQLPSGKEAFIVALTGWGQPEDVRRAHEAGCSAHMVKPVNIAELERLLLTR